jgi:hypothetical protein
MKLFLLRLATVELEHGDDSLGQCGNLCPI